MEEFLDPAVGARRGCEDCLTCRLRFAIVGGVVRRSIFDLPGVGVVVSMVCVVGTVDIADTCLGIVSERVPGNAHGVLRRVNFKHRIDGCIAGFRDVLVDDGDFQSRNKEGCLTNPIDKLLIAEPRGIVENLRVGPVTDTRARGLRRDLADDFKLSRTVLARAFERGVRRWLGRVGVLVDTGMPLMEGHVVGLAVAVDFDVETGAQRVDHGRTHTMQTACRIVRGVAEFRAGVQLGQDDLDACKASFRLDIDWDAAAVVINLDRAVGMQDHLDVVASARERLIDGIVDDLPQAVHQALAVGRADIHARAFAHSVEPLEHGQAVGAVVFLCHNPHSLSCVSFPAIACPYA